MEDDPERVEEVSDEEGGKYDQEVGGDTVDDKDDQQEGKINVEQGEE